MIFFVFFFLFQKDFYMFCTWLSFEGCTQQSKYFFYYCRWCLKYHIPIINSSIQYQTWSAQWTTNIAIRDSSIWNSQVFCGIAIQKERQKNVKIPQLGSSYNSKMEFWRFVTYSSKELEKASLIIKFGKKDLKVLKSIQQT